MSIHGSVANSEELFSEALLFEYLRHLYYREKNTLDPGLYSRECAGRADELNMFLLQRRTNMGLIWFIYTPQPSSNVDARCDFITAGHSTVHRLQTTHRQALKALYSTRR